MKPIFTLRALRACGLFPWDPSTIDFSKCLGKEKKVEDQHNPDNSINNNFCLKYEDFCNIVGPTKLQDLQSFDENNSDDNFQILFKIYKKFKTSDHDHFIEEGQNESVIQVECTSNDLSEFSEQDFNDMPIVINACNNENIEIEYIQESSESGVSEPFIPNSEVENIIEISKVIEVESSIPNVNKAPANLLDQSNKGNNNEPLSSTSSELNDCLMWPKTPERKNKRQMERLPFVISSSGWKKIYEDKLKEKEGKEKEKQEKERKREEKKTANQKPKQVKNSKGIQKEKTIAIKHVESSIKNITGKNNVNKKAQQVKDPNTKNENITKNCQTEKKEKHVGYGKNTNVQSFCLTSGLSKPTLSQHEQCLQNLSKPSHSKQNAYNISDKTSEDKIDEFLNKDEYQKETEFLTSKKYYLQDSRLEKSYEVSKITSSSEGLNYLQPAKLQPYGSGHDFSCNPLYSLEDKKLTSSAIADVASIPDLDKCSTKKSTTSKHLLSPVSTIRTVGIREFSTKKDYNCDCPPTASRNLTTVDSSYIYLKLPNDVPPLAPKIQRCQPMEPPRKCPPVEERIPRADDCYEVKPKKLPVLCPKTCPVPVEKLCEGKPLPLLKKRPVREPPKCREEIPYCEDNPRADRCLKVERRQLPKIKFSDCPKPNPCIYDVEPLKPLKKLYECEPPKICPKPKICDINDRADSKVNFRKPTLSKIKFDFIPITKCPAPPKIPLKRLPKLEGADPPKGKCEEVEEKCVRSDDVVEAKPCGSLPMLILKPENNCLSIRPKKRIFTSVKRKYSILAAIRNPWALSVLTANVIAFNYYHKVKLNRTPSTDNSNFEYEVQKNLSEIPTKALKKKSSPPSKINLGNSDQVTTTKPNQLGTKRYTLFKRKLKNVAEKSSRQENDSPKHTFFGTPKYAEFSKMLPASLPLKMRNYGQLTTYKNYSKSAASNHNIGGGQTVDKQTKLLTKKLKTQFLVYSINNHRAIHSTAKYWDKNDKKKKCGNRNCVKIKWPGLPPRQREHCQKEFKHKVCQKRKCPYPSFSECANAPDFPICECNELPKQLQPKNKIIPKLDLIKPAPPEWSLVDSEQESRCVADKLKMPPGETRTCENFYCPPQHIGTEYLTEEEKECPPTKPKPPICCSPSPIPKPTEKRKFEFKRCPPDEPVCSPPPEPCKPPSPPSCESKPEPKEEPQPDPNSKKCASSSKDVDPWSSPKKHCGPQPLQIIRLASTSAPHSSKTNLETSKSLWEVVCSVFKTNYNKSCEEIKCICKKLNDQGKSKLEDLLSSDQNPKISNSNVFSKSRNFDEVKSEPLTDLVLWNEPKQSKTSGATAVSQSAKYIGTMINVKNKPLWSHLCTFRKARAQEEIENLVIAKTKAESNLKYKNCKKCGRKIKSLKNRPIKLKHGLKKTHKIKLCELATGQITSKPHVFANSNFCQLSTTSRTYKDDDLNAWKQPEKTKPDILKKVEAVKITPEEIAELPPPTEEPTCGRGHPWPDCKTPTFKVCCENRHQTSCAKEYVHPKCTAQKAPFASFSERRLPFPKVRVTECEIQKKNFLIAKQKLQIYSREKPKHKYCLRCGTKSSKQYSTLATALQSFGYNHTKRYFSQCNLARNQKASITEEKPSGSITDKIMLEIKAAESKENELDSNVYYKLLKCLENYPEEEIYDFFGNPRDSLSLQQNNAVDYATRNYDRINVGQLYKNF
ncbi:hypothetical protein RN001_015541 [Aquatica leii]|uniref:Uncharacterized protein n=1 Tax=Aquatica leii TaxID=1421715 RepID=A0AAN7SC39_9COLE|nr:hypothetical protein RN001_015541 [Aquatica leii]